MKPEELMIGDWVFNKHHGHPIKMTQFDFFTHGHINGEQYLLPNAKLAVCRDKEPIPLTKEILEKNGFVEEQTYTGSQSLLYSGLADTDNLWVVVSGDGYFEGEIEYVHQLQHVLRVCKLEKDIVL